MPHDLPPWGAVYQQTQRWIKAGVFEHIAHGLRVLLRFAQRCTVEPSAAIFDSRALQSCVESGKRAGGDGHKRKQESKVGDPLGGVTVDALGELLALHVLPVCSKRRATTSRLPTWMRVTRAKNRRSVPRHMGCSLEVATLDEAKRGFVLLLRCWVIERGCPLSSIAWTMRFRRLVRDYERLPETLAGLHLVAFVSLMLQRLFAAQSP